MSKTPIFLSWSGDRSRAVASALKDWIPLVLERADPWHSDGIDAGKRWNSEIANKLKECSLGIICLTPENREKPWLLFEAGALSKSLDDARVMTFLLDMTDTDIKPPLADFQFKIAHREGTFGVLTSINNTLAEPRSDAHLAKAFEAFWPDLDARLKAIPKPGGKAQKKRDQDDILEEILSIVRSLKKEQAPDFEYHELMRRLAHGSDLRALPVSAMGAYSVDAEKIGLGIPSGARLLDAGSSAMKEEQIGLRMALANAVGNLHSLKTQLMSAEDDDPHAQRHKALLRQELEITQHEINMLQHQLGTVRADRSNRGR